MEFLNGVGLSTTLRDGEGIVIPHNKLRSAPIHLVRVRELHGIEKGNPFPEADVGAGIPKKETPTNASAEYDGVDGSSEGGRQ